MRWDDIAVPCDLPETVDEISYERVVMNAGTTWDYIPWHFDPDYARSHGYVSHSLPERGALWLPPK